MFLYCRNTILLDFEFSSILFQKPLGSMLWRDQLLNPGLTYQVVIT